MEKNSVRQDEVSKNKTSMWKTIIRISIIAILAILLLHTCGENTKTREAWNTEADSLKKEIALLKRANDSLKKDTTDLGLALDLQKYNSWKWELLASYWHDMKAILQITPNDSGQLIVAIKVPAGTIGESEIFIKNQKPIYIPADYSNYWAKRDTCITDPFNISVYEPADFGAKLLNSCNGQRAFSTFDLFGNRSELKSKSCVELTNDDLVRLSFSVNQYFVDNDLLKSANIKLWISRGLRLATMIAYNRLYHSDKQFAITANGIAPLDKNNPFYESNKKDYEIAGKKVWGERAIWAGYLGSEGLNQWALNDLGKAYYSKSMTYTVVLKFGKK